MGADKFNNCLGKFAAPVTIVAPFGVLSRLTAPIDVTYHRFKGVLSNIMVGNLVCKTLTITDSTLLNLVPNTLKSMLSGVPVLSINMPTVASICFS